MKKLKTTFVTFLLLLTTMPMLQSCLDDDWNGSAASSLAIGTVRIVDGKDYYFALDEGTKMFPGDTTRVNNYALVEGQRAFVYFNLLDEKVDGYDYNAQINHVENILTKDIYFMPAEKADSIGDDRINITNMWIADNYLNIQNAYDDEPNIPGPGIVSFKLDKIADQMAGKTGLNIRVRSVYDGERYMTIDFAE